jgi:hypothetical protein
MPSCASSAQAFIVEPAHAGEHTSGLFSQDGVGEGRRSYVTNRDYSSVAGTAKASATAR